MRRSFRITIRYTPNASKVQNHSCITTGTLLDRFSPWAECIEKIGNIASQIERFEQTAITMTHLNGYMYSRCTCVSCNGIY